MKKMIITLLLLPTLCMAGELSPQLHVGSHHFLDAGQPLNENNPGAGVVYERDTLALTAGGYYNSYRRNTYYVGAGYHWQAWGLDQRLFYGAVTGYEDSATPSVSWQLNKGPVTVSVMMGVIGFSLEY